MVKKVEVTHRTILFTIFVLVGLWLVYYLKDILFQLLVAFIITASFNPFVSKLEKNKLPRVMGVAVTYLIFLGIISFAVYVLAPSLVAETGSFVANVPKYIDNIGLPLPFKEEILEQLLLQLGRLPNQLAKTVLSVFSNVISVLTVFILSFYLLLSRQKFDDGIINIFSEERSKDYINIINKIENRIGKWAKAEMLLMFVIGLSTYVGLVLLRVPYALPLAILAGIFEIVPMVGPFIAAIPAVVIGFSTSSVTGIATASLAFLIQQVENYIFVPKIMQRSAGVNPVVTLLALSVGFRLQGVTGAIIAIPIVLALQVIVEEYISKKKLLDIDN